MSETHHGAGAAGREGEGVRYGIGQLAEMAGISTRTLRHYEDMGLLKPARAENGYRVYGSRDARRLSQILAMRACDLPLPTIRRLFEDPEPDIRSALVAHLANLRAQGRSLEGAIARTKRAIAAIEGIEGMNDEERFEALRDKGLAENERRYGAEARAMYGDEAVDEANARLRALSHDEWDAKELLEESIKVQLRVAMAQGDPAGEAAQELARMHERWIRIHWGKGYSREAHLGLARGYLADPRFREYYDGAAGEGATEFLVKALETCLA